MSIRKFYQFLKYDLEILHSRDIFVGYAQFLSCDGYRIAKTAQKSFSHRRKQLNIV